jgi:hypothetical protein
MSASCGLRIVALLSLLLLGAEAGAVGRVIRVDNSSNWVTSNAIGSGTPCTGTTTGAIVITNFGYTFLGRGNTASENYGTFDYCEVAVAGTLNKNDYSHSDENGLRALFGSGTGISAIRYDFLDNAALSSADGFQWGFYTFPSGVTFVALYGLDGSVNGIVPDSSSFINKGATYVWHGSNGYNGEYYCFKNNAYVGSWDGNASDVGNACLNAAGVLFINDFEGN